MPAHLNRKQQREIKAVVERAKKDNGIPQTAQQSIPFQRMFPDGICRVTDNYYTKTIQYQDINYQLAQQEDKTAIFDEWCSFLNFFDSSIHFELSFMNMGTDAESFEKSVRIPFQKDEFNPVRAEYSQMLKKQLSQGNNGLTKTKYLTFGIEAESMRQAKPRLAHIENDLLNNFRRLGVVATPMDGKERLRLMHAMFHMGDDDKFFFDWKWLVESGLSVKDFIAPTAFAFKNNRTFQMGSLYGSMSFLSISASDLSDRMLADFLDMESSQIVTIHIQSVDQTAAIKTIKRTITELDRSKIEEQKKAVRSGYDMDIIPSDLATYGRDAKALLKELQSQNERMFMVTFLVMNTGRTEQELENNVFQAQSIAQKHNCNLRRLDFQQEQGLMSSLPLAQNLIEIRRGLTTSSTAIFVPFTTQELFQNGGETLYYGLNALSNNLIMVDRKKLKNPNGLILGTPGSGKSFSAKREITNAFLVTDDDVIICDPEAEYTALVHKFHGQVVKISSSSTNYINPMDININYSEDDNPVALKADFILSLCELIVGSKDGLQPVEKTVIDRCVHQIYQRYFDDPKPENMPILEDLYALFEKFKKDNPNASSNPLSRWRQKHNIKKEYAAARAGKGGKATAKGAGKTAKGVKSLTQKIADFCVSHKTALLWVLAIGLLFMVISGMFSACSTMFQGGTQVVLGTSFTAEDEDILGTDEDYTALENDLRSQVDNIESTHPGYDEYRYALDEIGHNPYELAAYLTVVFEDYTREEVQAELVRLFEEQYDLELDEEVEIRSYTTTDEDGNTSTVYYEYRILNVTLTNYGLGNVIASSRLTAEQWERYKVLLETLGNRSYLFGEDVSSAPGGGGEYTDYDIPGEALTDTAFANMVREAEKYLGYPYVWGGSSPSTSFDCSGFVSWVINNCGNGWSVGRQTANGLKNLCDIIPPSEAKPGDLIFFQGTYNTSGASHVGIYVGNGMMIHCGDPISYASIETNYWQQHFYCFGRIP